MLKINDLTKYYGDLCAVDNISLNIKEGEIFGFIGPNGCGKSTTIRSVLNLLNYTGTIEVNGINTKNSIEWKEYIGYLPSEIYLYEDMTVSEMLNYSASFYKKDLTKRIEYLVNTLEIDITKRIDELSFGNRKKVGIVIALMHEPKLLIMDEPTSGLDPLIQENFFKLLLDEKKKGNTIFFSSHVLSEVQKVCDRVAIMKKGKIIKVDSIDNFKETKYSIVTLFGNEYKKAKLPIKDMFIKSQDDNHICFVYKGNINDLITVLSNVKLEGLKIEEPQIEEIFNHYYK